MTCNCISFLVHKNCITRDTYLDTNGKIQENGFFIHGTDGKKVLPGCEKIEYCPLCGSKLYKED